MDGERTKLSKEQSWPAAASLAELPCPYDERGVVAAAARGLMQIQGQRVALRDLASRTELNGKVGRLAGVDGERWKVELDGSGEVVKARERNLELTGLAETASLAAALDDKPYESYKLPPLHLPRYHHYVRAEANGRREPTLEDVFLLEYEKFGDDSKLWPATTSCSTRRLRAAEGSGARPQGAARSKGGAAQAAGEAQEIPMAGAAPRADRSETSQSCACILPPQTRTRAVSSSSCKRESH